VISLIYAIIAAIRILTWNLYHGRATPPAGRPLLDEFSEVLAGWEWEVALLQEVPPWWPPLLARATGAGAHRTALTSRNGWLSLRRAIARRKPDLIKSNGGGSNAILARVALHGHRRARLTCWPERRVVHGAALTNGAWIVNLHASTRPAERRRADLYAARDHALAWAAGAPLVLGGDFNTRRPGLDPLRVVASSWVDHVLVRGWDATGPAEVLHAGTLSDHKPLVVDLDVSS
jgi:endonuclease/exonuclease/phosphatase family metal-dependent hydrolase